MSIDYRIREDSWVARMATIKLGYRRAAVVIGRTIYLSGATREEFLADEKWTRHECCHLAQYRKYGTVQFVLRYLRESLLHGYHNNRFEIEARQAEDG